MESSAAKQAREKSVNPAALTTPERHKPHGAAPEDPSALAGAFEQLHDAPREALAMGECGRMHARRFGRSAAVRRWEELLREL